MSYASSLRTREIGIRRALGASRGSVIRLLLRQLIVPLAIGVLLGSIAGVFAGTVLEGEPFFLPAPDVATPLAAVGVFIVTACAAALVPAWRSLRLDPLDALRHE